MMKSRKYRRYTEIFLIITGVLTAFWVLAMMIFTFITGVALTLTR